jgi:hypothetical protein
MITADTLSCINDATSLDRYYVKLDAERRRRWITTQKQRMTRAGIDKTDRDAVFEWVETQPDITAKGLRFMHEMVGILMEKK